MIPEPAPAPPPAAMPGRYPVPRRGLAIVAALMTFLGCSSTPNGAGSGPPPPGTGTGLALETVASGLDQPLYLTSPPGDSRLFVVEQPGRIRLIKNGQLIGAPFLDITDRVGSGGERGLLSVAFHPNYATNRFFYVDYTDKNGDTRIERYHTTDDPDVADHDSDLLLLGVDQPYANHNGGLVMFGPDGKLYIGMGDGGSGGDPQGNGQKLSTLLGKLLRIDVDGAQPYSIPSDNPFAGQTGKQGEIWAYGLRNPWRFCFDAGNLYVADVGQNQWEEVDVQAAGSAGLNYGWVVMEGSHCFNAKACDSAGKVLPVVEYTHAEGCSITGGFVYRGSAIPTVAGHYFYGDYCSGWIRSFKYTGGRVTEHQQWKDLSVEALSSFGVDSQGQLYACSLTGSVYRFIAKASAPARRRR